jgi:hypothetical protein
VDHVGQFALHGRAARIAEQVVHLGRVFLQVIHLARAAEQVQRELVALRTFTFEPTATGARFKRVTRFASLEAWDAVKS